MKEIAPIAPKSLFSILKEKLDRVLKSEMPVILFPYQADENSQSEKREISEALLVWKFLREIMIYGIIGGNYIQKIDEKRKFIAELLNTNPLFKENGFVKIVAMIEALPDKIWRKLLWRENIDFMSFESCLRRMSFDQMQEIERNYYDLFTPDLSPVTPRVFRKSWRDRLKVFFGLLSVKKLLTEDSNNYLRNQSKGAYAFSLLGLDFGFSLYPKGEDDDTMITNQKFTRFLSVKEHINDFIVNKEDGKYWWLYKTARSNYAINPGADVQMKSHVCPGFWKTLIMHTWFWIVSPIALAIAGTMIASGGLTTGIVLPLVCANPMIIWTLVAIIRTVVNIFKKLTKDSKIAKAIGLTLLLAFALTVCSFVLYYFAIFLWICVTLLAPVCGTLLAVLFMLTAMFYIFFLFACVLTQSALFDYDEIPSALRFFLHTTLISFVIVMFDKFMAKHVIEFIVSAAQSFWQWYTADLLLSNWFLLALGFFGLFIYFCFAFLRDEEKFASYQKTFTWLCGGFFVATLIVATVLFIQMGGISFVSLGLLPALAIVLIIIAFGASFIMLDQVNANNIDERTRASYFIHNINDKIKGFAYKSYVANVLSSKWLSEMTPTERWDTTDKIQSLSFYFFEDNPKYRTYFVDLLIAKGNVGLIGVLNFAGAEIKRRVLKDGDIFAVVQRIVNGLPVNNAIDDFRASKKASEKHWETFGKILFSCVVPFVVFGRGIGWICKKIGQFFMTLKDLWEFFNKRCPFISQPRLLS